jgi:DNA polymerase
MPETTKESAAPAAPAGVPLKRAILERLRYERAFGLECLRPAKLERQGFGGHDPSPQESESCPPKPGSQESCPPKPAASEKSEDERWRELEERAKACMKCGLRKGATQVVFGTGNRHAKLAFVGEAPGFDEDQQGVPFVGKAGQLLNKIITAMKLKREDVYICNTVLCRPPDNRQPLPDEIAACEPFLTGQLEMVKPKVIVALGGPAAKTLLKTSQGITGLRGKWFTYRGIPVMPTFHPAFVLRLYTPAVRKSVWDDMKMVMERLKRIEEGEHGHSD